MARSRIIGNLRVNLGLNSAKFQAGLGRSQGMMRRFARLAKTSAIASSAAFASVAVGMSLLTRQGLSYVDSQAKVARSIDGSIDGLRALQIASSDAGVGTQQLNKGLQMMGARLAEAARRGGPAADMLDTMGLSAENLLKLDVDERLAVIADRAKELGFSASQAGDLLTQMGIRSKEMAGLIIQGGDAIRAARDEVQRFGLSITQDQAQAVERANDAMSRFGRVLEGLRVQLAINVAPALETAALRFQELATAGGPLQEGVRQLAVAFGEFVTKLASPEFITAITSIGTGLVGAMSTAADIMIVLSDNANITAGAMVALGTAMMFFGGPILGAITAVSGAIYLLSGNTNLAGGSASAAAQAEQELATALGAVRTGSAGAVASAKSLVEAHITQARAALAAAEAEVTLNQARIDRINSGDNDWGGQALDALGVALHGTMEEVETKAESLRTTLDGLYRTNQGLSAPSGAPAPAVASVVPEIPEVPQESLDALRELRMLLNPDGARAVRYVEVLEEIEGYLADGLITQEEYNRHLEAADQMFNQVAGSGSGAARAMGEVGDAAADAADETMSAAAEVENLFESMGSGLITGLGSWLKQGEYSMSSFREFLAGQLARIADMFLDMALKPIAGMFGDMFSGLGSGLFGGISGARATGGHVKAGRAYTVGEFGKETFIPSSSGNIIPAGGGNSHTSFDVTVNTTDPNTTVSFKPSRRQSARGARAFAGA